MITLILLSVVLVFAVNYFILRKCPTVKKDIFYLKIKTLIIFNYVMDEWYLVKVNVKDTLKSKYKVIIRHFKA